MSLSKTDYSELLAEIAEAEEQKLIKVRSYTEDELFLINAVIEGRNYPVQKAVGIVVEDYYEFYEGITEMSELAYYDYKMQKNGALADMRSFSLELIYELEKFVDWHKWGMKLQKKYNYIYSSKGIIRIDD